MNGIKEKFGSNVLEKIEDHIMSIHKASRAVAFDIMNLFPELDRILQLLHNQRKCGIAPREVNELNRLLRAFRNYCRWRLPLIMFQHISSRTFNLFVDTLRFGWRQHDDIQF